MIFSNIFGKTLTYDNIFVIIFSNDNRMALMYEIILYEDAQGYCPIQALIDELDSKAGSDKNSRVQLKQLRFQIDLLHEVGTWSGFTKHIRNGIWELKPGNNRILFFFWKRNTIVLLHSFRKRSQKTPEKEIAQAEREKLDWISRYGHQ